MGKVSLLRNYCVKSLISSDVNIFYLQFIDVQLYNKINHYRKVKEYKQYFYITKDSLSKVTEGIDSNVNREVSFLRQSKIIYHNGTILHIKTKVIFNFMSINLRLTTTSKDDTDIYYNSLNITNVNYSRQLNVLIDNKLENKTINYKWKRIDNDAFICI